MADIFLSYKSQNRNMAEALRAQVMDWGYTVWWDQDLKTGENYVLGIDRELSDAKAVIVLLSTGAIQPSDQDEKPDSYVLAEAAKARRKKPLIPVIVPPAEADGLPPPFNTLHSLPWARREDIHVELRKHGLKPTNPPIEKPVYRQDVFTLGIPTHTEVDRSATKAFQDLQANLRMRGRIVRFFGPTQTGKSVLARQALEGFMPLELDGGSLETRDAFYDLVAIKYAPDIPADARILRVKQFLTDSKRPVIIDDFHRMPTQVQNALIDDAKGLIAEDVNLVLISIPDCAGETIQRRAEFRNRSIAIEAPRWTSPQLRRIPIEGFRKLRAQIHPRVIDEIILQAYGNPQLVQDYCYKLCERRQIIKSFDNPTPVVVSQSELMSIFREVGRTRNYPMDSVLSKREPETPADRRVTLASKQKNLQQRRASLLALILIVLDGRGGFSLLKAETIASHARKKTAYFDRAHVTAESVLNAGIELVERLHAAGLADTAIDRREDKFFIQHPDFKVHLHWRLAPQLTGVPPELEKFTAERTAGDIQKAYGAPDAA